MPSLELATLTQISEELKARNISFVLGWFDHVCIAAQDGNFFTVDGGGIVPLQRTLVTELDTLVGQKEEAMFEAAHPHEAESEGDEDED